MKSYPRLNFITTENIVDELEQISARKGASKSQCLNEAVVNYITQERIKQDGGIILPVENPQNKAEASKVFSASVLALLCELRRLDPDEHFRTGGTFKQLEQFLYQRLVAENSEDGKFRF